MDSRWRRRWVMTGADGLGCRVKVGNKTRRLAFTQGFLPHLLVSYIPHCFQTRSCAWQSSPYPSSAEYSIPLPQPTTNTPVFCLWQSHLTIPCMPLISAKIMDCLCNRGNHSVVSDVLSMSKLTLYHPRRCWDKAINGFLQEAAYGRKPCVSLSGFKTPILASPPKTLSFYFSNSNK